MHVLVAIESRFDRTPDGHVWSDAWSDYRFWQRYLDVFDAVRVLARVRDVAAPPPGAKRADGPHVKFAPVPYFVGPWQFARVGGAVRHAVRAALAPPAAVVLRVPGTIGTVVHRELHASGRPYGVEVVGDPYDVFSPGSIRSVTRPFMRRWYTRNLRRQCAGACAAAYVTAGALQRRYPPAPGAFTTAYSSIELRDEAYVPAPREIRTRPPYHLVCVGGMDHLYKAQDVLIEAVARCAQNGADLRLTLVGDGKHRAELETLAQQQDVGGRVGFEGARPPGPAVRDVLDRADLFVLPSRQEGLPRALLEAMARGLPCVSTHVGGIPELLPAEDRVAAGDAAALAGKIQEVLADAARRRQMAARNLAVARDYRAEELQSRRREFYNALRAGGPAGQG